MLNLISFPRSSHAEKEEGQEGFRKEEVHEEDKEEEPPLVSSFVFYGNPAPLETPWGGVFSYGYK